jgi:hypothetical protein
MSKGVACTLEIVVLLQLIILAVHDTIPLGRWNNMQGFRSMVPVRRRVIGTTINTATGGLALWMCLEGLAHAAPGLLMGLIVLQAVLFVMELRAWWVPYFFGSTPETVAHLRPNWEGTIAFLPVRHAVRVNAMHCLLHALTLAALVLAIVEHSWVLKAR